MAFKRIFAILLGMIMTVEAVPAVVFAAETEISSKNLIVSEEEAGETEAAEAPVSETTVKKEKETTVEETKKEPVKEETEPAQTETEVTEAPEETKEAEPGDKAPAETEPAVTAETEGKEPEETESSDTSESKKEKESEEEAPATTEPGESAGQEDKEQEPSATADKETEGSDSKVPSDSDEQEEEPLKEGEIAYEAEVPALTHIPSKTSDNDKQLESYFKKNAKDKLNSNRPVLRKAAPSIAAGSRLGGNNRITYDSFRTQIADVAKGLTNSTELEVPIANFNPSLVSMTWTKEDLGVTRLTYTLNGTVYVDPKAADALRKKVSIPIDIGAVDDALLADCPFDLYWFDKTQGVIIYSYSISAETVGGVTKLKIVKGPTGTFAVSKDYMLAGSITSNGHSYTTDPAKISRVNTAVSNAAAVVNNAQNKTDYQKLVYYCNQIMERVQYNYSAAGTGATNYGDPWQLISVFDDDSSTNVVCEGYAKAFMYLCELTSFKGDISCITVTGDIPAGGHMWNVVNMDDGKNYMVDVTNIDGRGTSTDSYFNTLFLAGYTTKVNNSTYKFGNIQYVYDRETLGVYSSNQIAINNQKYYTARSVTAKSSNGKVTLSKTSAFPDEEVTFTAVPNDGYTIDCYKVNGNEISETKFTMTGVSAVVEVVFKPVPHSITVKAGEHGSASADPVKAGVGETVKLNIKKEDGYCVKSITVNGEPIPIVPEPSFKMLPEEVTVEVEFELISQAATGEVLSDGINNYRIINNAMDGTGTVAFAGSANHAASVSVPGVVNLKGIDYRVTKIASWAFNRNTDVTSVYIGANVTAIDTNAFVGCTKLVKISGGYRLKTISSKAIISCTKLKSFSITSSVLSKIGSYAFKGDKSLKTIYINKTTKLSKKRVKKSLKGSSVKTVKVKKSKVRKYKKYFTKKNCGRKVKVKK